MGFYTIAWLVILGAAGVVEWLAFRNAHPGDTLSEHVWRWFAVTVTDWSSRVRRILLLAAMVAALAVADPRARRHRSTQ